MKEFAKNIIRFIYRISILRSKRVSIPSSARFNLNTNFEGFNKIGENTCVSNATIGKYSFIGDNSFFANSQIGRFCSIASNVTIVAETHPSHTFVSTSPIFFSTLGQCNDVIVSQNYYDERLNIDGKSVIIGNDVWIGRNVLIKGGIRINDGAIVAMGAVVTKDVPPYAIVGGVPAKVIGYRFSPEEIEIIQHSQWWNKDRQWLKEHFNLFHNVKNYCKSGI